MEDQNELLKIVSCILKIVDRREIVPLEACFEHTEYKLMKQCCEWQPHHRPKLSEVRMKLTQIIQHTGTFFFRPLASVGPFSLRSYPLNRYLLDFRILP